MKLTTNHLISKIGDKFNVVTYVCLSKVYFLHTSIAYHKAAAKIGKVF